MRPGSIIHRYIFRELITPFMISIAFLMFVFLMTTLINIMDYVVNYRVGISTVLLLIAYSMPYFLQYVIPMSVMIGVLLAFLKMSSDNEIIALKAGGMSIYAMLPPVAIFCLIGCIFTAFIGIYAQPWAQNSENALERRLNTASITALLKERIFNTSFDKRMLYVSKIDPLQNTLAGVFIEDRSTSDQAVTITAPSGHLTADTEDQVYFLELEHGQMNQIDLKTKSVSETNFDTYRVRLDLKQGSKAADAPKKVKEMNLSELREYINGRAQKDEPYYLALIAFHRIIAIPFACFAMGLLAVPLGVQSKSARRSFGIGLGIFFFLGYYLILSAGEVYGRTGHYPPVVGMWAANIVMGGIGFFLLIQCARERTIGINWLLRLFRHRSQHGPGSKETPSTPFNP